MHRLLLHSGVVTNAEPVLDIPFADAFRFDASPTFAELRETRPLARVRTLAGAEVWLVTRYDDVRLVLSDPRFSRAAVVRDGAPRVALAEPMPSSLATTDPPEHTRLRRLVAPTFAHRRIERTRPWVASLAASLADDVAAAGDGADLRQIVALPLPIQVICHLLRVPYDDRERFREWTELGYSMRMAEADRVEQAMTDLTSYISDLVDAKLADTTGEPEDLLDELVRVREEGDRLSAEELLRFNRFSEVGQLRIAVEHVELHGVTIRAGDGVMAALNAANRDPRQYDDPDALVLDREDNGTCRSGTGRTSASAPSWPGSSRRRRCSRCCGGSRGCGWPSRPRTSSGVGCWSAAWPICRCCSV